MNNMILPNIEHKKIGIYSLYTKNILPLPETDTVNINNKILVNSNWSTLHTFLEGEISSEIKYTSNVFIYDDETFFTFQQINNHVELFFKIKLSNVDTVNSLYKIQFKLPVFLSSKYPCKNNEISIEKNLVSIELKTPLKPGQLFDEKYLYSISYLV